MMDLVTMKNISLVYRTKYYYGGVKKHKFSFSWHWDWWKINHVKKDQGDEKLTQISIFSKLPSCPWGFKKKECSAYYRILFTPNNIM